MTINTLKFPEPTNGYKLRLWQSSDTQCIIESSKDPYIPKITSIPKNCNQSEAIEWIKCQNIKFKEGNHLALCIEDISTRKAVGMMGIFYLKKNPLDSAHGGYWINPKYRKKGIAKTMLKVISLWGLNTLNISKINLYIEPHNTASTQTAKAVGYTFKDISKNTNTEPTYKDMHVYTISLQNILK